MTGQKQRHVTMVAKLANRGHHASCIMHGHNGNTLMLIHSVYEMLKTHRETYIYSKKCSVLLQLVIIKTKIKAKGRVATGAHVEMET